MSNLTISSLEQRINSIYSSAITCSSTAQAIRDKLNAQVYAELNSKYANGRNKYTNWLKGFASGYIMAKNDYIMNNLVEFCYDVDGVLYSTHKKTDKRSTKEFYANGKGQLLGSYNGNYYWKHNNKPYTILEK